MSDIFSRDWLTPEEAEAFIGKKTDFYIEKWNKHPKPFFKGWNWAAAIFRIEWMVYRKMYLEAAIIFVAAGVFGSIVKSLFGLTEVRWIDSLFGLIAFISFGLFANVLYRKKALRTLRKTGRMHESHRLPFFKKHGGTSVLAVIICEGILVALLFYIAVSLWPYR